MGGKEGDAAVPPRPVRGDRALRTAPPAELGGRPPGSPAHPEPLEDRTPPSYLWALPARVAGQPRHTQFSLKHK